MSRAKASTEFILGLAQMLGLRGKSKSAEILSDVAARQSPGLMGTRTPVSGPIAPQAPVPEFGSPRGADVMSQAERVRQGLRSDGVSTGVIGTRNPVGDIQRQAPVPEFGSSIDPDRIPEAMRVLVGQSRSPVVRGPNAGIADALQERAPELANIIRANDALEAGPSTSLYNTQPGLPFRFPAGAEALAETVSTRGRITPAGTRIGGRPYTPESMATPRNVETTRMASATRQADAPDAPARMPEGQREIDMRSNPELLMAQAYRTAPTVPAGSMGRMGNMGVNQVDLSQVELTPRMRQAMGGFGLAGIGIGTAFFDENVPSLTQRLGLEQARLQQEGREDVETIAPPNIAPLSPEAGVVATPRQAGGLQGIVDDVAAGFSDTPTENQAIRENVSRVTSALQQADPEMGTLASAFAPRDPSYYTPERGGIQQYYKDRENYVRAMSTGQLQEMADAVKELTAERENEDRLSEWAMANPGLAYELINRASMANPGQNQQSGQQVTSQALGSSLGTNNSANAMGQAQAAGQQVYAEGYANSGLERAARIQQNNEIISASAPITYAKLQPTRDFAREQALRMQMGIN